MAIEENGGGNGFYMPVAPAYNGGNNGGFGFGGDWGWIILLLLCANGGWGFGGMGGGMFPWMMMGGMGGFGMDYLYPWLNNSQHISDGFRDQMLNTSINGIQNAVTSGFGDVQTALCGGFAGVNATVNSGVNTLSQQLYNNTIADMNRSFALQSQLADCCCENRLAAADNKYTIATEACATRTADAQNTNALLTAITGGIQSIKDQLCTDKIESKNDIIAQLRSELMFALGQASQDVQTAAIQAGPRNLANEIEQYVLPTPRPAWIVQNPNCCTPYTGCNCGVA